MHINNVMGPFKVGNIIILNGEFFDTNDKSVLYRVYHPNNAVQVTETLIEMPIEMSKKVKDIDNETDKYSVSASEDLEIKDIVNENKVNDETKKISEKVAMETIETPKPTTPKINNEVNLLTDLFKKDNEEIIEFHLGFIPAEPCNKVIVEKGEIKGERSKRIKDDIFGCADVSNGIMKVIIHGEGVMDKMKFKMTLWNKAVFNFILHDNKFEAEWNGTPEYIKRSPIVMCKKNFFKDEFYILVQNLADSYPEVNSYQNFNHYEKSIILVKKCNEQCVTNEKWPKYLKKMHLEEDEAIFVIGNGSKVGDKFDIIYEGYADDEPQQVEVTSEY